MSALLFVLGMSIGLVIGYYIPDKKPTGFHSSDPVCPHELYYDDCPLCRH